MASASLTPTKDVNIDCFVCFGKNVTSFKLSGRKCLKENFQEKLSRIIDVKLYEDLVRKDASVCRNCFSRISTVSEFIQKCNYSAQSFLQCSIHKRGALSPLTPRSASSNALPTLPVCRSRKMLKLGGETTVAAETALSETLPTVATETAVSETLPHILEHGYVSKSIPDPQINTDTDPVLMIIRDVYNNMKENSDEAMTNLRSECQSLTSRTAMFSSVLLKYRGVSDLIDNAEHLLQDIILEMRKRVPLLLEVLCCAAIPANGKITSSLIPILASCYGIIMKHRFHNLSAYQRLTTAIGMKGGLDDRFPVALFLKTVTKSMSVLLLCSVNNAMTRLNHLGLTLSTPSRIRFQESVHECSLKLIIDNLKSNPLIKITGDNLDIYVKTSLLTSEKRNQDLHLFTSNIIFSRIATVDMSNERPNVDETKLTADNVMLTSEGFQQQRLSDAYRILLARILCNLPAFQGYRKLIPEHIPHEYAKKMEMKSLVFPLPIQFKNESKHEDCLAIMDVYEDQLIKMYTDAFGNTDVLRKFGVPVGGDQLTRVRLQEAKNLRCLSVTPERRLDDLYPIVCEMWHNKQDFLEKCFKTLYKASNNAPTLSYFKTLLNRSNVTGKVKGKFQPHFDLLMSVGEGMITEQFLEFFNMEDLDSEPQHTELVNLNQLPQDEQKSHVLNVIQLFMKSYGYGMVEMPHLIPRVNIVQERVARNTTINVNGQELNIQFFEDKVCCGEEDEVYNYCILLCHWYLHALEMHDTAKEGDVHRAVLNCKYALPFFYSHSKLSKYLVENINYVLQTEYLLSPLQSLRVLEGSFVNTHGGKGKCVESDLVQEHSVCNQKSLIKSLGANKTEKSISRATTSADAIAEICSQVDRSLQIKPKSGRHSQTIPVNDQTIISRELRKIRPFRYSPGRKCQGFSSLHSTPVSTEDIPMMKNWINHIIRRLTRGQTVAVEENDECEHNSEEEDDYL